jgi:hypothetical protein
LENQLHAELREAMAMRPIAANSFVLLWKDSSSSSSERFVDALPFSLAKVLKACEVPAPGCEATLEVSYWVCPSGDPNRVFQQGVDEEGHVWRDVVPRESVLLCDVEFAASGSKKGSAISKYLHRDSTLKKLTQLGRLPGWCMETGYGMVYHDPALEVKFAEVGDWFLVPITRADRCVKKNLVGDAKNSPVLLVEVLAGSKAGDNPKIATVSIVQWYYPSSGNPSDCFLPVFVKVKSDDGGKKDIFVHFQSALQLRAVVGVASCHKTGVISSSAGGSFSSKGPVKLRPEVLAVLCNSKHWFMSKWMFDKGVLSCIRNDGAPASKATLYNVETSAEFSADAPLLAKPSSKRRIVSGGSRKKADISTSVKKVSDETATEVLATKRRKVSGKKTSVKSGATPKAPSKRNSSAVSEESSAAPHRSRSCHSVVNYAQEKILF